MIRMRTKEVNLRFLLYFTKNQKRPLCGAFLVFLNLQQIADLEKKEGKIKIY
jgi:hypothetical protein